MAIITQEQLQNAAIDAQTFEDVVNGSETFDTDGVFNSRLGTELKTIARVIADLGTAADARIAFLEAEYSARLNQLEAAIGVPDFLEVFDGAAFSGSWTSVGSGWSVVDGIGDLDMASSAANAKLIFDLPASTTAARVGAIVNLTSVPDTALVQLMAIKVNGNANGVVVSTAHSGGDRYILFTNAGTYNTPTVTTANYGATTNVTTDINFQKDIMLATEEDDISFEVVFNDVTNSIHFYVNGLFIGSSYNGSTATDIEQVVFSHDIHVSSSPGNLKLKKFGVSYNSATRIVTPKIPIIWAGGQSNMVGFGGAGDYVTGTDYAGDHSYYNIITNTPQALNVNKDGDLANNTAPTIYYHYMRQLTESFNGGSPFLLYNAIGSSGFIDSGVLASHKGWLPGEEYYQAAEDNLTNLFSLGGLNATDFFLHSMIWHQGETDATLGTVGYATHLANLETMLRTNGMGFDIPFIVGQLAPDSITTGETWNAGYNSINAELETFANGSIKRGFVSSEYPSVLAYDGDNVHIDGAGLRTMGARYADQYTYLTPTIVQFA